VVVITITSAKSRPHVLGSIEQHLFAKFCILGSSSFVDRYTIYTAMGNIDIIVVDAAADVSMQCTPKEGGF
jgi:hypothetical protein